MSDDILPTETSPVTTRRRCRACSKPLTAHPLGVACPDRRRIERLAKVRERCDGLVRVNVYVRPDVALELDERRALRLSEAPARIPSRSAFVADIVNEWLAANPRPHKA